MDTGVEERFARVNVAAADHRSAVQKHLLDRPMRFLETRSKRALGEIFIKRLGPQKTQCRHAARINIHHRHCTKTPRITVARHCFAKHQVNMFVLLHFGPRLLVDAPGTAHSHMRSHPGTRAVGVFKNPNEHLGATLKIHQPQALNVGQMIQGTAQRPHTRNDFSERFAHQVRCETASRYFNFRQFRHNHPKT